MKFTKMHGLGNDFIVVNGFKEDVRIIFEKAEKICDRHAGVGADGILLVLPSDKCDLKMRIINSDGSEADMCGNGIRCFARYAFSRGLVNRMSITVETPAGVIKPEIIIKDDLIESVRVDMGCYSLRKKDIPVTGNPDEEAVDLEISVDDRVFKFTGVSMGNPHCVIFVDDVEGFPVERFGPAIERHPLFPKRTNVEFVEVKGQNRLKMRVWERGAGLTMACGTGACASAVAAYKKGIVGPKVTVSLPGGDLFIEIEDNGRVYMTGPAVEVYSGYIDLNTL
ncbi:diaminopimelate epimerase [Thermosediminibacter litoriperuensis]|uniref:Diaminopimelate epimerase n=1 Tax=Thermosediminibacter litoriperuensis TaxID=291989 RepID=A0A5S5AZ68_9FIRM|nr:diaminopimelate epimerase [Thermosediminibacter litoriperuensis]TYP60007.1 diaminopimelate epimerase [Thermosediminibacter litoriperuensis]